MKTVTLRSNAQENIEQYIPAVKRSPHRNTQLEKMLFHNMPEKRRLEIEKFLRNAERGCLPMSHDGADVTRQITAEQVAKFQACKDCQNKPVISFPFKKQVVGVCAKHWADLSETVIGWSGE